MSFFLIFLVYQMASLQNIYKRVIFSLEGKRNNDLKKFIGFNLYYIKIDKLKYLEYFKNNQNYQICENILRIEQLYVFIIWNMQNLEKLG